MLFTPSAEGTLTWENEGGSSQSPPASPRTSCLWHPQVSDTPHPKNTRIPGVSGWALPHWNTAPDWPFGLSTGNQLLTQSMKNCWAEKQNISLLPNCLGWELLSPGPMEVMQWLLMVSLCRVLLLFPSIQTLPTQTDFFPCFPTCFPLHCVNFSFKKMFSTHQNRNDAFEFLFHQITNYFVIEILNRFPLQREEITGENNSRLGKKQTCTFQNISVSTWLKNQSFCQSLFTHHICFPNIAFI